MKEKIKKILKYPLTKISFFFIALIFICSVLSISFQLLNQNNLASFVSTGF